MPNDAKLGLVIGLGLVIAVAVVYFRGDSNHRNEESSVTTAKPAATTSSPSAPLSAGVLVGVVGA